MYNKSIEKSAKKEQGFDFEGYVYQALLSYFGEGRVGYRDLFRYFAVRFSFKKETSRAVLRAVSRQYPLYLKNRGIELYAVSS